jgi:hypothetical protein
MTDTKQPEALRLAHIFDCPLPPEWTDMVAAATELRRLHAENTTLQQGYDAARLEIEALRRDLENARHNLRVSQTSFRRAADERDLLIGQQEGVGDYPALPTAPHKIGDINLWPASQMRAYADATCAMRAQADSQPALPKITAEDRSFLHYNPNTDDIVEWVQHYASAAITADRAMLEQAAPRVGTIGHIGGGPITLTAAVAPLLAGKAAPAAVAGPVAYRVLRKRHDGEWVTDGRAWCDGVPTQDLVDDIALRSDGWRIEYAFAIPTTQAAPVAHGDALPSLFREALAWGMTYGPEIPAHQWEEMRESMVEKFTARAQAKEGQAMTDTTSAAPTYEQVIASWNAQADEYNQWGELGEDEKIEWALKCADQFRGATKMMQVAQQALEALEAAVSDDRPYFRKSKSAIAALREALEAAP